MPINEESSSNKPDDVLIQLLAGEDIKKSADQEDKIRSLMYELIKSIQKNLFSNLDEKIKIHCSYYQRQVAIKKCLSTILNETFQVDPSPPYIIKKIKKTLSTYKSIQEFSGGANSITIEDTLSRAFLDYDQLFQIIRQRIEKNIFLLCTHIFKKDITQVLILRKDQLSSIRRMVEDFFSTLLREIFDNNPTNPLTSIEDHFWRGYHNKPGFKVIFGRENCEEEIFDIIRNFTESLDMGLRQFYSEIIEKFEKFDSRLQNQSTAKLLAEKLKKYLSEFYLKLLKIVRVKNKIKRETIRNKATNNFVFFTIDSIDEKNEKLGNPLQNQSAAKLSSENVKNFELELLKIYRLKNNTEVETAIKEAVENLNASLAEYLKALKLLYPQNSQEIENFRRALECFIAEKIPIPTMKENTVLSSREYSGSQVHYIPAVSVAKA